MKCAAGVGLLRLLVKVVNQHGSSRRFGVSTKESKASPGRSIDARERIYVPSIIHFHIHSGR